MSDWDRNRDGSAGDDRPAQQGAALGHGRWPRDNPGESQGEAAHGQVRANNEPIGCPPDECRDTHATAHDRSVGRSASSNDACYRPQADAHGSNSVLTCIWHALDAPPDVPDITGVTSAAAITIRSISDRFFGAQALAQRVRAACDDLAQQEAPGKTQQAARGRESAHLMYWFLRGLAARLATGESVDQTALCIAGAWLVRGMLTGWQPAPRAVAKVSAAALRPTSRQAQQWGERGRDRMADMALHALASAVEANPDRSVALGLSRPALAAPKMERSPWSAFNEQVRRRAHSLRTLSSSKARRGAGGHGSLDSLGVRAAGEHLLARLQSSDPRALVIYLESLTHLTASAVLAMPIVLKGPPPAEALAWLDLDQQCYRYVLFRLHERGARLPVSHDPRYEHTTQTVTIGLSPIVIDVLRHRAAGVTEACVRLDLLVGDAGHHPRAALTGNGGYRVTARRLQEAMPVLLLSQGHGRWPALLATSSPYLVSAGRDSYGACDGTHVDQCVLAMHDALHWPPPLCASPPHMIGSRVTPTTSAVVALLDHLAARADRDWLAIGTPEAAIEGLRWCAPWVAAMLSLGLALRQRNCYYLAVVQLFAGRSLRFNDKDLPGHEAVEVPICRLLQAVVTGWCRLARGAAQVLSHSINPRHRALAASITEALASGSMTPVFGVDAALRLVPAGWRTWHDVAAPSLRLVGNFGRQYWPLHLTRAGVSQRQVDILLRHELGGSAMRSSMSTSIPRRDLDQLCQAMDDIFDRMHLRLPIHWRLQ